MKYAFKLGRNPDISMAELGCFFGKNLKMNANGALAFTSEALPAVPQAQTSLQTFKQTAPQNQPQDFLNRLGSCTEVLEIFAENVAAGDFEKLITDFLLKKARAISSKFNTADSQPQTQSSNRDFLHPKSSGKFPFAINLLLLRKKSHSSYEFPHKLLRELLPRVKKSLRAHSIKANFMNKDYQNVSDVLALKQGLLRRGASVNIIEISSGHFVLGHTVAIQDFEMYSMRDYRKPFRDAYIGMLPPKLAQVMVNLAAGQDVKNSVKNIIWDPFCGTGSILMEALLTGFNVIGSDANARILCGTEINIGWLKQNFLIDKNLNVKIFQKDAREISRVDAEKMGCAKIGNAKFNIKHFAIATEPFLGKPLKNFPDGSTLNQIIQELFALYLDFFRNLAKWLPSGTPIVFIFPYWKNSEAQHEGVRLAQILVDKIEALGYSKTTFVPLQKTSLFYDRPDQIVGREIIRFVKNYSGVAQW